MANASPADLKKEGEKLKALFAKVKKKQHNCAFLLTKDGIVVEAHIKKAPEIMMKAAKKAGGSARGAWGTMTMDGQVIILDPINDKVPGNLPKIAKKYFSERGMKFRLEIKEPEEGDDAKNATEDSAEDSKTTEDTAGAPAESEAEDLGKKLVEQLAKKQKEIDILLADTDSVMHSELEESLSAHERMMSADRFDLAGDTLHRVENALEDYARMLAEAAPFIKRMAKFAPGVEKIKKGQDSDAASAIGTAVRGYDYALENREWGETGRFLDTIEALVGDVDEGVATDEPDVSKKQLAKDVKHIAEIFKLSVQGMDKTEAKKQKDALTGIAGKLKSGDLEAAQNLIAEYGDRTGITPQSPLKAIVSDSESEDGAADVKTRKKALTKAFTDLTPEIKRSMLLANPAHKEEMKKLVTAFGAELKSSNIEASEATLETFKAQIKAFDQRREEGRTQRKRQFEDIRSRAAGIAQKLEQMAASRGVA